MHLRAFRALMVAGPLGLTPGALTERLGVPATSLSFHLKELTHSGLVSQERQGGHLIYRASFDRMNALLAYLTETAAVARRTSTPLQQRPARVLTAPAAGR